MKIVCLGDSLTYGFGVSSNDTWVKISDKNTSLELINKGINGDTSGGMLSRFNKDVVINKPQISFIMGGVNDLIMGADLGCVKANISAMVHQSYYENIVPVIGIPIKPDVVNIREDWAEFSDFYKIANLIIDYREFIIKFCMLFKVNYIDFYTEFSAKAIEYENVYLDGVHPNKYGNRIMAEIFCKRIDEMFGYIEK